jgi:hypothetical protein
MLVQRIDSCAEILRHRMSVPRSHLQSGVTQQSVETVEHCLTFVRLNYPCRVRYVRNDLKSFSIPKSGFGYLQEPIKILSLLADEIEKVLDLDEPELYA